MRHVHPMICLSIILYTCTCTGLSWSPLLATCYFTYGFYSVQTIQYTLLFTYADLLCCCLKDFFFLKVPTPSIRSIFEHKNVGKFLG